MPIVFKKISRITIFLLLGLLWPWLVACGSSALTLAQPGQPTLVFIYTDG